MTGEDKKSFNGDLFFHILLLFYILFAIGVAVMYLLLMNQLVVEKESGFHWYNIMHDACQPSSAKKSTDVKHVKDRQNVDKK